MRPLREIFLLNSNDWVFHGSSRVIEGDSLNPRKNTTIDGIEGAPLKEWVFASEDPRYAILHGIKTDRSMMLISPIWSKDGHEYIFTVIENRQKFMNDFKGGHVYKLPKDNFTKVAPDYKFSIEWTSLEEQNIRDNDTYRISDLDSVLRTGLQVFFIRDGMTKEEFQKILDDPLKRREYARFEDFIKSPDLIWENGKRKIYPHPLPAFMK